MPQPVLRITQLHLRGLGAIRALNLPEDGLGWDESVPSSILIGGVNGSGKTTLLDFIARALHLLVTHHPTALPKDLRADEALIDFEVRGGPEEGTVRFLLGTETFFARNRTPHCFGYRLSKTRPGMGAWFSDGSADTLQDLVKERAAYGSSTLPSVLYIPSESRVLQIPKEKFKSPGKMPEPDEFIYQWVPAMQWKDSLEARLYSARWEDLNAKEEGRPEEARNFDAYARAFREFTGRTKSLLWRRGSLRIEVQNHGEVSHHSLDELSSGEKQVLIIVSELLLRWRPGSLVLLDEPELHLHPAWQQRLWEVLLRFLKQRGGQLIAATQSPQLFAAAEPGTKLLLGGTELG